MNRCRIAAALVSIVLGAAAPALAQLNGQHIKGSVGLKAGSQPPPGGYVVIPVLYFYGTDTIVTRDGDKRPSSFGGLNAAVFGAGLNVVTTRKVLGGSYGFSVILPWADNRLQGTEIDANPGAGITDMAIQPISLGWHLKRADVMTGYTMFVPTGRYEDGASNNTGLGMWGHELALGTTVYLDSAKKFHAGTLATFDFQSKKKDSDTKVGNILNLEGGLGGDFLKGGLTTGLSYYATFKLTDDQFDGFPNLDLPGKNKVFGIGPEGTLALRCARRSTASSRSATSGKSTRARRPREARGTFSSCSSPSRSSCPESPDPPRAGPAATAATRPPAAPAHRGTQKSPATSVAVE